MDTPRIKRLYLAAGICAALSSFFSLISAATQANFAVNSLSNFSSAKELLEEWTKNIGALGFSVYDFTVFPGLLLLISFMAAFALVCLVPGRKKLTRKVAGMLNGVGIGALAGTTFVVRLLLIAAVHFEGQGGDSAVYASIVRILANTVGLGFFEVLFLNLFALSMLLTAVFERYRSLAVAMGAVCIYRLFADHGRFVFEVLRETPPAPGSAEAVYGLLFFLAMVLALCSALIIAVSSFGEERGRR